jgi:hypothetical protein
VGFGCGKVGMGLERVVLEVDVGVVLIVNGG